MTTRLGRTLIGWCGALALVASCSSSGGAGGTGGAGATNGGSGGAAPGGNTGSGGVAGTTGGVGGGQAVGISGGSVTQAGVTLDVPANAVSTTTTITVATTTAPSGYTLASMAYEFGPAGTVFAQPVAVTIPLTSVMPGIHVFWSNSSGGFDDVGGTVNGSSITANVSHFSIGFCAVPKNSSGSGGAAATGGASGGGSGGAAGGSATGSGGQGGAGTGSGGSVSNGSGGSGSGVGGSTGAAGTRGTGAAGSSGTGTGGSSETGAAGSSGAGGTSGPTDAGLGPDAASSLCKAVPLNLAGGTISLSEAGAAPDPSTYTGGTLASGKSYLNAVTHYGGGPYTGARQEQMTIDTTAQTIVIGQYLPNTPGSQYLVMTYAIVAPNTLQVTVACNSQTTPTGTFEMYYAVSGSQITMTTAGSNDVLVYGPTN